MRRSFLLAAVVLALAGFARAAEPTAAEIKFFETTVRPILAENCFKCHGPKKEQAGLRLDAREFVLKGGDSGPALVSGKPEESLLIEAIRHEDETLKMPPTEKLSDRQIADLTRWVEMGAPFPATRPTTERSRDPQHWSFLPLKDVTLPTVNRADWVRSPIDQFVLARLEAAGLEPAAPADRLTLIRRVTFDLTGLPPTPEEIETFLGDTQPDAFARLVDRLLESSAYGEKWGRHWLDVARYADSNGLDENIAHGNAWRYRDYVVNSFNRDKPFDKFLTEQLAGDLLTASNDTERQEQLIATGFLVLGAKVLAEVDETKMQMDIVDEQIDTTGRAFLGLTLGCARCHDHKFDPIDAIDYYGLAGVFKSTRAMEHYKKIAKWHENVLPSPETEAQLAKYEAELNAKKQAIETLIASAKQELQKTQVGAAPAADKVEASFPAATQATLKTLRAELATLEKNKPELPSAMGVVDDTVADVAIHIRGNHLKLGDPAPRHVPPVIQGPQAPNFTSTQSGRLELANWMTDSAQPLVPRVFVNRVWRWHFGQGLVGSTDNFGLLGDVPSHPELLDWLARRFVADGWSLKSLHRLLLNSSTYQQSGTASAKALAADPENQLLARFELRRLDAEEVRDALLAVSGKLDRTMGGSLLHVKNRAFLFDHTSKDMTSYASNLRSIYLPVIRNNTYDMFQLLDFPDAAVPTSDRVATVIAPQALLMLNSELVIDSAQALAKRLLEDASLDDQSRQVRLYQLAYGRTPTEAERLANETYLGELARSLPETITDADARRLESWGILCQTVFAANEFIFVK